MTEGFYKHDLISNKHYGFRVYVYNTYWVPSVYTVYKPKQKPRRSQVFAEVFA